MTIESNEHTKIQKLKELKCLKLTVYDWSSKSFKFS